jgi:F-type H+-transporting ATPase subunit b
MDAITRLFEQFGVSWGNLLGQLVTFVVLLLGLRYFLYAPTLDMLESRKKRIKQGLADAEAAKADREQSQIATLAALQEASRQGELLIQQATLAAESLRQSTLLQTREELERLKHTQAQQLAQAKAEMLIEVKKDVIQLVVLTTQKVLQKELTKADREQVTRQAIEGLNQS